MSDKFPMVMTNRIKRCTMPTCGNPMRVYEVTSPLGKKIDVTRCNICDKRKCKEGHPIQNPRAAKCPDCGEIL